MKRITPTVLTLGMSLSLLSTLVGCGGNSASSKAASTQQAPAGATSPELDPSESLPNAMVPIDQKVSDQNNSAMIAMAPPTGTATAAEPVASGQGSTSSSSASTQADEVEDTLPPLADNTPDQPQSKFRLAPVAFELGSMSRANYLPYQKQWVGSTYPACNFFLITALCEAGYCEKSKPMYVASHFDSYFRATGWTRTSYQVLKERFTNHQDQDAVFQRKARSPYRYGHVMIPIGYDPSTDKFVVAEASLGTATNKVEELKTEYLETAEGGFRIYLKH